MMSDKYNSSFKKYLLDLIDGSHDEEYEVDGTKKKKKKNKSKNRDAELPLGILKYLRIANAANS